MRQAWQELSERKLRNFIEFAWPYIEPGRPFVPGWHIDAICDHLEAVTYGHILRLLINIPPGCMKSLLTNVLWPAWEWGPKDRPSTRYIAASYSDKLTIRDNRRCRSIIQSPSYQLLWKKRFHLVGDQNSKVRFDNNWTGFKIATSVGGVGVGERGDRFIIDDANNIKEVESDVKREDTNLWLLEVVPTRLSDPEKSAIINIQQRTHEQDASGTLLKKEFGYVHLCLPMEFEPKRKCFVEVTGFEDPRTTENELLWSARMTRAVVERDKIILGSYATAGQFQQSPGPRGGGMFKKSWWRFYHTGQYGRPEGCDTSVAAILPKLQWMVISVDAAFKKKPTGSQVGLVVVGGWKNNIYVLDDRSAFMTFTETLRAVQGAKDHYPLAYKVLVEDKANGTAVVDTLSPEMTGVEAVEPEGGKESRAAAIEPTVEGHFVYLPEGAPWLEDFVGDFSKFPKGMRKDRIDALSQAIIFMRAPGSVGRSLMLGSNW